MPTVILLDVSLSMCRSSSRAAAAKEPTASKDKDAAEVRQLANVGIGILLDYFAQNAQLECTALVLYSTLWELRSNFTRNHASIKNDLYDRQIYDKSNVVNALKGILTLKLKELYQSDGMINIIVVTDGQYCQQQSSCTAEADDIYDIPLDDLEDQFDMPCKLQVVCLTSPRDPTLKYSLKFFKKLVRIIDPTIENCPVLIGPNQKELSQSAIWLPASNTLDVTIDSIEQLFTCLADTHYKPYHAALSFGQLSSMVLLSPKPTDCLVEPLKNEFDDLKKEEETSDNCMVGETFVNALNKAKLYKLNEEITICGFMPAGEVSNSAVTSRHYIFPVPNSRFNEIQRAQQILSQDPAVYFGISQAGLLTSQVTSEALSKLKKTPEQPDTRKTSKQATSSTVIDAHHESDITKQPSFCALLHNSLKQENLVAICIVGKNEEKSEDWFGVISSQLDVKKKSGLILSLLLPGPHPILWLPNFRILGSVSLNSDLTPTIMDHRATSRGSTKSYSSLTNVIWLDPESVQADVQRVVRYAKRGPDRAPAFYKELNRVRRAALSCGFFDVLTGLASILENERLSVAPDQNRQANQAVPNHIDHAISCLRSTLTENSYDISILPMT